MSSSTSARRRETVAAVRHAPVPATAAPLAPRRSRIRVLLGVLVLLALVALPLVAPATLATTASRVLALALLAVSLDLLVGVGGLPSLGHAAPFGVGVYAAALTAREVTTFAPVQLVASVSAGALLSALLGWLVVRTRGTYFLMLTLAFAELVHTLAGRWEAVTGGTNGLVAPRLTFVPGGEPVALAGLVYWWILGVTLLGFAAVVVVARSAFGRSLRGVRDNEARMASLGYSTFRIKYTAFVVAGAVAGLAGGLWIAHFPFATPDDLGFSVSAFALLAVVLGGRGSLWGAALGAALVVVIRDEVGAELDGRGPLLLGIVFIAAVYLLPRGFAGLRPGRAVRP